MRSIKITVTETKNGFPFVETSRRIPLGLEGRPEFDEILYKAYQEADEELDEIMEKIDASE